VNAKPRMRNLIAIVLVAVVAVLGLFAMPSKDAGHLEGKATYVDGSLVIENADDFDWRDVSISLNDSFEHRRWIIQARSTFEVSVLDFTQPDGRRFDPTTHALRTIQVRAETSSGQRFCRWEFEGMSPEQTKEIRKAFEEVRTLLR